VMKDDSHVLSAIAINIKKSPSRGITAAICSEVELKILRLSVEERSPQRTAG